MRLIIKNKLMSLRGNSSVKDEQGNEVFIVKGKLISPTKKKFVYDLEGNRLFTIRNKFWHLFIKSAYIYNSENKKIAKFKNKFFKGREFTSSGYEDAFRINKNPEGKGRAIYKNEEKIGVFTSEFFKIADNFTIEYDNPENGALLVAILIAVDNINDNYFKD